MKLHSYFQDKMLIQQGKPIVVNGYANAYEQITISFCMSNNNTMKLLKSASCTQSTTADENGLFSVTFGAQKASFETWEITARSSNKSIIVSNILIGELWLTFGQSNMQYETQYIVEYDKIKADVSQNIRILQLKRNEEWVNVKRPGIPLNDFDYAKWFAADEYDGSEFVIKDVSGLAMLFAIKLQKQMGIPIGIINTAIGGTAIQSWVHKETIDSNSLIFDYLNKQNLYINDLAIYDEENSRSFNNMSGLFNEKIAPMKHIKIKGAIWYQGESNTGNYSSEGKYYKAAMGSLIESYRKWFKNKNLPFVLVQITPYRYDADIYAACYVNEAISSIADLKKNTYVIPTYDLPNDWLGKEGAFWHPVHPIIKEPIASRIFNCIHSNVYSGSGFDKAPCVKTFIKKPDCIFVQYKNTYEGLKCVNGIIEGFTISDCDGVYYKAIAKIINSDTIQLCNKYVTNPQNFTYAFCCYPQISNLYNSLNIPAIPYRSKREEIGNKPYYPIQYYTNFSVDKIFACYGEANFGGATQLNLWGKGTIHGSGDVKFKFSKYSTFSDNTNEFIKNSDINFGPHMEVAFTTKRENNYIFSISPTIDVVGMPHCLENYSMLTFEIENNSEKQIKYLGLDFMTIGNNPLRFNNCDESGAIIIDSNAARKIITVDMTSANNSQLETRTIDSPARRNIHKLQFTFFYEGNGSIKIRNMEFHNQRAIV